MQGPYLPIDNKIQVEVQQAALLLGLSSLTHLKGGHTEAVLYKGVDTDGRERVMKIGSTEGVNVEVDDNVFGYNSIRSEGAEAILPEGMLFGDIKGRHYIIMPFLGIDIAARDRVGDISATEYTLFADTLVSIISNTIKEHKSTKSMQAGLLAMHTKLQQWFNQLVHYGAVDQTEADELMSIDITSLVSNKTSLMIMDLTPDNTFFDGEKVSFIDPWKQDIYRGSFVPSLHQFVTLATEIYGLPQAKAAQDSLHRSINTIGKQLGLTPHQIHGQAMLGNALQYALSGYVRLESDSAQADNYIQQAKEAIYLLKNDIIQLKKGK